MTPPEVPDRSGISARLSPHGEALADRSASTHPDENSWEKRLCSHHSCVAARPDVGPSARVRGRIPWVRLIHANGRFTLDPEIFAMISAAGVEPPAESDGSKIASAD